MNWLIFLTFHPLQRFIELSIITVILAVSICPSASAAGLYVTLDGTGGGFVTSDPPGISCPIASCFADFPDGSPVSLIPTPNSTSTFSGWSNACTNTTGNCSVTMNSATTAGAHFTASPKARIVATGTGYPTLGAAYSAANSGDTIMALDSVMPDTGLNIDAAMAQGKSVTIKGGYTADYSGRSLLPTSVHGPLSLGSGSLQVDGLAIIPNDNVGTVAITATSGAHGAITPTGVTTLSLGASQTYTITPNTGYTIAALTVDGNSITPATSYSFSNVQADHTISAIFSAVPTSYTLSVTTNGGGTVTSSPPGIYCGSTCSANFSSGSSIILTAMPNSGYTFTGWSGSTCSGTGTCTVAMSGDIHVTAEFTFSGTTVRLDESALLVPQVKRLGLNLGGHNYWDQAQFMKSVIVGNPGFEGITINVTVYCDTGTSQNTCVRASLGPDPAWGDSGSILTGFWNGASYEIITGAGKGRTGTVVTHIGAPSGSSWLLSGSAPALAVGDYMVLRREYPATGLDGWWPTANSGGTLTVETVDLPPGTQGTQALRLNQPAAGADAHISSYFDSGDGAWHPMLKLNGTYTVKFKAKLLTGNNQVRVTVNHGASLYDHTFTLSNTWQEYTGTFTASEDGTVHTTGWLVVRPQGQTEILLDDLTLSKNLADTTNPTVFADSAVNALREYNPGVLRYWGRQLGDTIDNQLATPYARKSATNSKWTVTGAGWEYSLHEFLELCEVLNAEPWYVTPNSLSTTEMAHLMEYLGGAAGTTYGDKRIALGHATPWTTVFSKIHIEFGNEDWNSIFEGIDWPIPYGQHGNELFATAKATPQYLANTDRFDFVLGGQSVYLGRNQQIHNASSNHDSLAIAPYMMFQVDNFASNEELFGSLFAEAETHSTRPTTHDGSATALGNYNSLQASSRPVPLSIYEVNLHTTNGSIDQTTLDAFTPSLGAGLGVSSQMLQMMRGMNVLNQMLFSFAQESFDRADGKSVKLWGTIVDHGITDRRRPQFLAARLANTVLQGSMFKTVHEGIDPTWNQPLRNGTQLDNAHYLQSFLLVDGVRRGLILYNLHRTSAFDITFSGAHPPQVNVSVNRLTGTAINATNESASNVTITPQNYTNFDPMTPFTLPPYSMTVLKWTTDGSSP